MTDIVFDGLILAAVLFVLWVLVQSARFIPASGDPPIVFAVWLWCVFTPGIGWLILLYVATMVTIEGLD